VKRIIERRKMKPDQLAIYDSYEQNFLEQVKFGEVRHLQEMQDMTDLAYGAIKHALKDFEHDGNLAVNTAWKVLKNSGVDVHEDRAVAGGEVNTQVNVFGDQKAQKVLDVVSSSIAATTAEMGFRLPPVGAPSKHRRISEAETVTQHAAVEAEVVDAEVLGEESRETGLPASLAERVDGP
jgi:hypothetical protein